MGFRDASIRSWSHNTVCESNRRMSVLPPNLKHPCSSPFFTLFPSCMDSSIRILETIAAPTAIMQYVPYESCPESNIHTSLLFVHRIFTSLTARGDTLKYVPAIDARGP